MFKLWLSCLFLFLILSVLRADEVKPINFNDYNWNEKTQFLFKKYHLSDFVRELYNNNSDNFQVTTKHEPVIEALDAIRIEGDKQPYWENLAKCFFNSKSSNEDKKEDTECKNTIDWFTELRRDEAKRKMVKFILSGCEEYGKADRKAFVSDCVKEPELHSQYHEVLNKMKENISNDASADEAYKHMKKCESLRAEIQKAFKTEKEKKEKLKELEKQLKERKSQKKNLFADLFKKVKDMIKKVVDDSGKKVKAPDIKIPSVVEQPDPAPADPPREPYDPSKYVGGYMKGFYSRGARRLPIHKILELYKTKCPGGESSCGMSFPEFEADIRAAEYKQIYRSGSPK